MRFAFRLWRRFAALSFAREAEYRANFLVNVGEAAIQVTLAVLTLLNVDRALGDPVVLSSRTE